MERRVHTYGHWLRVLFCGLAVCGFARSTAAFTMSDGSIVTCRSYSGRQVDEVIQSSFSAAFTTGGFTGVTVTLPDGSARITWDSGRLNALPREAHDYIYFHECAHAHVPTSDEVMANCAGLLDMRAAGRSSEEIEERLGAFHAGLGFMGPRYGNGADYWARTLRCARQGRASVSADRATSTTTTTCQFTYGPRAGQTVDFGGQRGVIPAMVGAPCGDGGGSFGTAVATSTTQEPTRRARPSVSTGCYFDAGPLAGRVIDYAPRPPIPVGSSCNDGFSSVGHVIP